MLFFYRSGTGETGGLCRGCGMLDTGSAGEPGSGSSMLSVPTEAACRHHAANAACLLLNLLALSIGCLPTVARSSAFTGTSAWLLWRS
jgi:hypothetical protein